MELNKKELAKAIKLARISCDESQKEMGLHFGLAQQVVGKWEKYGEVPAHHWPKLQELYGINPADFQMGEKPKTPRNQTKIGKMTTTATTVNQSTGETHITNGAGYALSTAELYLIELIRQHENPVACLQRITFDLLSELRQQGSTAK